MAGAGRSELFHALAGGASNSFMDASERHISGARHHHHLPAGTMKATLDDLSVGRRHALRDLAAYASLRTLTHRVIDAECNATLS